MKVLDPTPTTHTPTHPTQQGRRLGPPRGQASGWRWDPLGRRGGAVRGWWGCGGGQLRGWKGVRGVSVVRVVKAVRVVKDGEGSEDGVGGVDGREW